MFDHSKLYATLPYLEKSRTWAEIDIDALKYNYEYIIGKINSRTVSVGKEAPTTICVVKADAYGHGACEVVPALIDCGCHFFAVSSIEEGIDVRNICRKANKNADILILGYAFPTMAKKLAEYDIITSLPSFEYAKALSNEAKREGITVRAHVKLDTGLNRIGFPANTKEDIIKSSEDIALCTKMDGLRIEGMFTHFANADSDSSSVPDDRTRLQANRFEDVSKRLSDLGVNIPLKHISNSASTLRFGEFDYDAVRLGICLYGVRPSEHFSLELRPVMKLKTIISHIHKLSKGEEVSYGGSYKAEDKKILATLPIGYADGFLRAYSGASVLVETPYGSYEAPIIGRICMDQCIIDITEIANKNPRECDEITLFGDKPERLYDLACRASTIPYEVICLITSRVTRIYKNMRKEKRP